MEQELQLCMCENVALVHVADPEQLEDIHKATFVALSAMGCTGPLQDSLDPFFSHTNSNCLALVLGICILACLPLSFFFFCTRIIPPSSSSQL